MYNNNHIYNYSGFLLIDLVISIGIFSIICLSMACANWQLIKQEKEIDLFRRALNISNNIIEEINGSKIKIYDRKEIKVDIFTIKIEILKNTINKFIVLKINTYWKTEKEHQISMITAIII